MAGWGVCDIVLQRWAKAIHCCSVCYSNSNSDLNVNLDLDLMVLILLLGVVAFGIGTACGVVMAKLMNLLSAIKVNPLIGAAGVSAVPMAARVVNREGLKANPQNYLLMHAMGPNVAGVIGSAIAAGVLIKFAG